MEFNKYNFDARDGEHNAAMAAPSDDEVEIIEDDEPVAEELHHARLIPHEQLAAEPFDVAYVHEQQHINGLVPQQEVLAAIQRETNVTGGKDYAMAFNAMQTQVRHLSTLKHFAESQRESHAISLLRECSCIIIDNQFLLNTSHCDVIPHVKEHFINFVLYLGNHIGLDALLPPQHILVNQVFFLTWNFHQRNRLWPDSVGAHLPFSTTSRMMCMGKRFQEEFWIAFTPHVLVEHDDHHPPLAELMAPLNAPSSALLPRHQNMFIMFLGFIFARLCIQDIVCDR
ncbi:hypothetical protein JVT61DRAFT_6411 [Boletus reticuloceps]|uniref:DUF8190 domain-containing protein n=1 Tax=Boletus reticuloceps TaxID=495285 RepID=A0A8I2YJV8_9AGAM|nr:hypothetical protein JVT61DRAFT_6411 [Boletus reticuloceps]